jgi:hypothetical protein
MLDEEWLKRRDQDLQRDAYHEAGHAFMAWSLGLWYPSSHVRVGWRAYNRHNRAFPDRWTPLEDALVFAGGAEGQRFIEREPSRFRTLEDDEDEELEPQAGGVRYNDRENIYSAAHKLGLHDEDAFMAWVHAEARACILDGHAQVRALAEALIAKAREDGLYTRVGDTESYVELKGDEVHQILKDAERQEGGEEDG